MDRDDSMMGVDVVYCPAPGRVDTVNLRLPAGATVADALRASGLLERHALVLVELKVGVWSKARELGHVLRERDGVEVYRPLTVDPKEARRLRYKKARSTAGKS